MAKLDPRADPVSVPPTSKDDFSVDRVAVPKTEPKSDSKIEARAEVEESTDESDSSAGIELESSVVPAAKAAKQITSQDPRYEPIEKLLDINDWKKIGEELGPLDAVGKLPPNLGLVAALAHNENAKDGDPEAVTTAIRCMAGLLGVSEDSALARVMARRLLRKNPVRMRDRKAPPARTSLLIVLVTLVGGGGVGWLLSIGSWRGVLHALHL